MRIAPLVSCVLSVAIAAFIAKLGGHMMAGILIILAIMQSRKVFEEPKPPFEKW